MREPSTRDKVLLAAATHGVGSNALNNEGSHHVLILLKKKDHFHEFPPLPPTLGDGGVPLLLPDHV